MSMTYNVHPHQYHVHCTPVHMTIGLLHARALLACAHGLTHLLKEGLQGQEGHLLVLPVGVPTPLKQSLVHVLGGGRENSVGVWYE